MTLSGGYFHGYYNGTEYPFYFDGYKKTETYTKAEVDALLKNLKDTYLTSNYFVRNGNSSKPFTLTYGNENASITMPEGKAIYANVLGINVPLVGSELIFPAWSQRKNLADFKNCEEGTYDNIIVPQNGYIYVYTHFNTHSHTIFAGYQMDVFINGCGVRHIQKRGNLGSFCDSTSPIFCKKGDKVSINLTSLTGDFTSKEIIVNFIPFSK